VRRPIHAQLGRFRSNVAAVAWPPISTGSAAAVAMLVRQLELSQWWPRETIEAAQRHQLRALAHAHARATLHFAERLGGAGLTPDDLGAPGGLAALPPLTRRDLQELGDRLFAGDVPPGHTPVGVLTSSGSTGEPVRVRRTRVNDVMWSALTVRDHLWRDLDFRGRAMSSRFSIDEVVDLPSWGHPFDLCFVTGPSRTVPFMVPIEELGRQVAEFSPHVLQVYASVLDPLARHLADQGTAPATLRYAHTIGETLSADVRDTARELLGIAVWDSYTCEEVGNIALQCPESTSYHVMAESVIVEILDDHGRPCSPGERGRVVVTDLLNLATPMIRYELGDLAEQGGTCACGRGLPTITRILGRHRNLVRLPDGTRHWPILGVPRFREIAPVRQFRLIQRTLEEIDVEMVIDEPVTAAAESALTTVIQQALGHPFRLRFTWLDEPIARSPNGKFEEFRCDV